MDGFIDLLLNELCVYTFSSMKVNEQNSSMSSLLFFFES